MTSPALDRRRTTLAGLLALACAACLLLVEAGPEWARSVASLAAVAAALGAVVIADLNWQRALTRAERAGLVAHSR